MNKGVSSILAKRFAGPGMNGSQGAIWSCQELFSPRVQGYEILGGLSRLGYHIARRRRQVKGGDSRGEANPLDVAPTVCYPLPQAACALACSR